MTLPELSEGQGFPNPAAKENELQQQIDNIESTHPGYDEYRYDLDSIGHNPHELASYLLSLIHI